MSFRHHFGGWVLATAAFASLGGCPAGLIPTPTNGTITVGRLVTQNPPNATTSITLPLATSLQDGLGFSWDIQDDGVIQGGGSKQFPDAFDNGMILETKILGDEREFDPGTSDAHLEDGREIVIGPVAWDGGLLITRKIFVSPTLGFARWLDILENPTDTDISVESENRANLASDDVDDSVFASSDGDTSVSDTDEWWIDGQQFTSQPTLAVQYRGTEDSMKSRDAVVFDYGEAQIVKAHSRSIRTTIWFMRSPNRNDPNSLLDQEVGVVSSLKTLMKSLEAFPAVDAAYLEGMTADEVNDLSDVGGNVVAQGDAGSVGANVTVTVTNTANGSTRTGTADATGAFGPLNVVGAAGDTIEIVAGTAITSHLVP